MVRYIVKLLNTNTRRFTAVFVLAKSAHDAEIKALLEANTSATAYDRAQAKVA